MPLGTVANGSFGHYDTLTSGWGGVRISDYRRVGESAARVVLERSARSIVMTTETVNGLPTHE